MKPPWLRVRAPGGDRYQELKTTFREKKLFTVCEEARCPNVGECWREGTATVMLLGDVCTRGCRFCAVTTGKPGALDESEPEHVAEAISGMALQYVVLTMVDRDDLPDGGATQVARTVRRLKELRTDLLVETLVGDFQGATAPIDMVLEAGPDVFAHNIEVVRRITRRVRDVRCGYDRTLSVLRHAKERHQEQVTKSSIMVGIGETDEEVVETLRDLRSADVDIVTIGQYLRPTPKHHEVERYVTPGTFAEYERVALDMGFRFAASGPLVRSSYKAAEVFVRSYLRPIGDLDPRPTREGEKTGLGAGSVDDVLEARLREARSAASRVTASLTVSELAAREAVSLLRGEGSGLGRTSGEANPQLVTLRRKPVTP